MKKILSVILSVTILMLAITSCDIGGKKLKPSKINIGMIAGDEVNDSVSSLFMSNIDTAAEQLEIKNPIIKKQGVTQNDCYETATKLSESCNVIFVQGKSLEDYIIQAAQENPKTYFFFLNGEQASTNNLANYVAFAPSEFESRYVSGVAAGYKLNEMIKLGEITSEQAKVGFVAVTPTADNISAFTAFYLGIKSICNDAEMYVQYTGEEPSVKNERIAANALFANGCVLISQFSDLNGAAQTGKENQKYYVGVGYDLIDTAEDFYITSIKNDYSSCYYALLNYLIKGEELPKEWSGGYSNSAVGVITLNVDAFLDDKVFKDAFSGVEETEKLLKEKKLYIFDTTKWSVDGKKINSTENDKMYNGEEYITDGHFAENEKSSLPRFSYIIDGITEMNGNLSENEFEIIGG